MSEMAIDRGYQWKNQNMDGSQQCLKKCCLTMEKYENEPRN